MQSSRIQQKPKDSVHQKHSADSYSRSGASSDKSFDLHLGLSALVGADPSDIPLTTQNILALQRTIGNQAVDQLIQAKLKVGPPGAKYEDEPRVQPAQGAAVQPKSTYRPLTPLIQRQAKKGQPSSAKKIILQKNGDIWVLVSWLNDKSKQGLNESKIYAPEVIRLILEKWRQFGALGWISDKDIQAAAEKLWIYGPVNPLKKYEVIKSFDAEILSHFSLPSAARDIQMLAAADYSMIILIKGGMIPQAKPKAIKKLGKKVVTVIEQQTGMSVDATGQGVIIRDLTRVIQQDWSTQQKTLVLRVERNTSNSLFDIQQNKKWDKFVDKLKKENKVVFSYKQGAAGAKGQSAKKGRKPPAWAVRLKKNVQALIEETRKRDPKTEYLPDKFYLYFFAKKQVWRGGGVIYGIAGKDRLAVGVQISKKIDAKQVLKNLLIKLRGASIKQEIKGLKKAKTGLDDKYLWAEKLRQDLWKLAVEERKGWKQPQLNLPDALGLYPQQREDGQIDLFLIVTVQVKEKDDLGEMRAVIRQATLPQPLHKNMQPEKLFPTVKDIASALRRKTSGKFSEKKIKAQKEQAAFPAYIIPKGLREDNRTVTNGEHEFFMALKYGQWYREGVETFGEAWATNYTQWTIYRIPAGFTIPEKPTASAQAKQAAPQTEKEKPPPTWQQRRGQLQQHFEDQKETITAAGLVQKYQSPVSISNDILLKIPPQEGTYLIYAKSQIKPSETRFIHPSHAVYVIKAVHGYKLAAEETEKGLRAQEEIENELKQKLPEKKRKDLQKQLDLMRRQESMSLYQSTAKTLNEVKRAQYLLNLLQGYLNLHKTTKRSVSALLGKHKDRADVIRMMGKLQLEPPIGGDLASKIKKALDQLAKAKKSMTLLSGRIGPYKKDFKAGLQIYTPIATLASEVTGRTYPFLMMLGEASDSSIDHVKYVLVDMSNPNKSKKYHGAGKNKAAAIRSAFKDFAENNDYGEGYIAYRVPGVMRTQKVRSKPGFRKKVLSALKTIALAAGMIALAIGAVATGGTSLALLGTVLGVAAGVSGAIVAAENIRQRSENYRMEYDAEFFLDVLNIAGGAASLLKVAGSVARAAKVTKAAQGAQTAAKMASAAKWAGRLQKFDEVLLIHSGLDVVGNAVFTPLKILQDLKKIDESDLPAEVKASMKQEVIVNGLVSGFMIAYSAYQFKGEIDQVRTSRLQAQVLQNEANYLALLKKAGIAGEDGSLLVPKAKAEAAAPVKTPAEAAEGKPGKSKAVQEPPAATKEKGTVKVPETPAPPKVKGEGGQPAAEVKPKAWDDPSLTENEMIKLYEESIQNPTKKDPRERVKWLRQQYRAGRRFNPATSGWPKPFKGKARVDKAVAKLSPKARLANARSFVRKHKQGLLAGDAKALQNLLDVHGNWKDLVNFLRAGTKTQRHIADQLNAYRQNIVQSMIGSRGGAKFVRTLEGASTKPESDVDLNFYGQKAGERMLKAEAQMEATFGSNWREKFRINFYTEPGRLTRFQETAAKLPRDQRARSEAEITALTEKFNFAKMLKHAGKNKTAVARINKLMKAAGIDPAEVRPLAKMSRKQRQQRRQDLHKEIDALERAHAKAPEADKLKLAEQITKKQMEANFLTTEAYIGPGAVKSSPATTHESYQSMLSQLEFMEKEIAGAGGDVVKAMREYEIYKYMFRFSQANKNKQLDLLYDELPKQISKINRQGAKGFTDEQIRSLYRDFMNYAYNSLKAKRLGILVEGGGKLEGSKKSWNSPDLSPEEMIRQYRAASVKSREKLSDSDLKKKYAEGWRFDDETRQWRKPFKPAKKGGGSKEISFEEIKDLQAVAQDPKVPATQLGLDQSRLDKFKNALDADAVARIQEKTTLDQIKGQLAEEVTNKIGSQAAAQTEAQQGGQVSFFRGDQVAGPAPTGTHGGAQHAPLTDGMIAEVIWKNGVAEIYIHRIFEVKSGHASASEVHKQVEWDIERIKELGLSLKIRKPDGSEEWHFFTPEKIKMPARSKQKEVVSAFTPTDVTPPKTGEPTREFTARDLPGITSEDLHLAALMVLRNKGISPSKGDSSSAGPQQLSLPLGPQPTAIRRSALR